VLALMLAAALSSAEAPTAAAPAQPPSGQVRGPAAKAKAEDPNAIVCSEEEAPGSLIRRRVCTTRAQRDAREQAMQSFFHNRDEQSGVTPSMSGGMGGH